MKSKVSPKVSVIVPCYNQAVYLPMTLDSVLSQTSPDWECVIVNDGSPDNTDEIAHDYCKKDSRFKYVKKENGGLASARNFGVQHSTGEFILPLDADDLIGSSYIEKAVKQFVDFPETKLVYCYGETFGDEKNPICRTEYNYDSFIRDNCFVCTSMFRRSDFDKIGGYNLNMKYGMEDWDFWLSLLSPDSVVYQIKEVNFYYRKRGCSMLTDTRKHNDYNLRQIVRNHPDIYAKLLEDVLFLWTENGRLIAENVGLRNSLPYKIGLVILRPYRRIKALLTHQNY